jgi:hypothetical protein
MPIRNDEELAAAVAKAGEILQEIQDYAKRDFSKSAKVRFPRGYLRPASEARAKLGFLAKSHVKSNISYTMLLSDLMHWILVRTDLSGTAKEMAIKLQIFLLGSVVESVTKIFLFSKCGGNYSKRTEYLARNGIISIQLKSELDWLWKQRNKMHLFQLDASEWLSSDYTVDNHNRAVRAFKELLGSLNNG